MRNILDKTNSTEYVKDNDKHMEISRVNDKKLQVLEDKKWKTINLKAAAVNASSPGEKMYSRDLTYYEKLVKNASELGANCVAAKDLLPPEFYTAVSRFNSSSKNKKLYIMQTITPPEGLSAKDYMTESGLVAWKKRIETVLKAIHGDGAAKGEKLGEASYFTDVSAYLLGVTVDPKLTQESC
jgi:hypothetical protein